MIKKLKHIIRDAYFSVLSRLAPEAYAGLLYKRCFRKPLNWEHPTNIDEKINWLKFNSDTTEWTRLADKYLVRDYVEKCGLGNTLVKLYGKWDNARDIEWDKLPNQFVLKANNGSGDILLCHDKAKIDKEEWAQELNRLMKLKFGYLQSEPHYNTIKPCIIAEELLDNTKQQIKSSSLIDYKIWFKIFKFFISWLNKHISDEMCLPCDFYNESNSHACIFVSTTISINYIKLFV